MKTLLLTVKYVVKLLTKRKIAHEEEKRLRYWSEMESC